MTAENSNAKSKKHQRRGKKRRQRDDASAIEPQDLPTQPESTEEPVVDGFHDENALDSFPEILPESNFGRVSEETMAYLRQIEPMLSEEALDGKDAEERQLLIQNIYEEVDGKEISLATEYTCSRILEKLIRVSEPYHYRVFLDRMRGQFFNLLTNRFASHVMQTLLSLSALAFEQDEGTAPASAGSEEIGVLLPLKDLFLNMCSELEPYWSTLMVDTYGSHILRLILNILSGNRLLASENADLIRSKASQKYHESHAIQTNEKHVLKQEVRSVPPEFNEKLAEIALKLVDNLTDIEIRTLTSHAVANPVFQSLLILHKDNSQLCDQIIDKILMGVRSKKEDPHPADDLITNLLHSQIGSHLLEKIIECASQDVVAILFENYFSGKMMQLAMDSISNYVLQQMLEHLPNEACTKAALNELGSGMKQLLFRGRVNVVHKLVECVLKNRSDLTTLRKSITAAFVDSKNEDQKKVVIELMLRLQSFDDFQRQKRPYQFAGAKLIQQLLEFPNDHNIFLIASLLGMTNEERLQWTNDKIASRVIEAFLSSAHVGEKVKRKLIRGFEGKFNELAKDKYGSHLVDKCWMVADIKQKIAIAEELVANEKELAPSFHGRFVLRNCRIDLFKRRKEDWIAKEEESRKKRELFTDIMTELNGKSSDGQKSKKHKQ